MKPFSIQGKPFVVPSLSRLAVYYCSGLILCLGGTVYAETNVWTGARTVQGGAPLVGGIIAGDPDWSSEVDDGGPSNWAVPVPPPNEPRSVPNNDGTADIQFNGVVGLDSTVDQTGPNDNRKDWSINSMAFGLACTNTFTILGQGHPLSIKSGVANNSPVLQQLSDIFGVLPLILTGPQTWQANTGDLLVDLGTGSGVTLGTNNFTIDGSANTTILPKLFGSGALNKTGTGTLFLGGSAAFNTSYTGPVTVNNGILQIDGAGTLKACSGITVTGTGTLLLHRPFSIGAFTVPIIFNGGKLSAVVPVPPNDPTLNVSDRIGTFTINNNASTIQLDPENTNRVVLTFASGSRIGSGTVTITNWTGTNDGPMAVGGTDDSIFVTAAPDANFLNGINFAGFPSGGARLATGEIVPAAPARIWNGGGADSNWSTGGNWVGGISPLTNGTALVSFGGNQRLGPQVNATWDVLGVDFLLGADTFTMGGTNLTIRSHGITNNSTALQTFANNLIAAAPQTWNAKLGSLFFTGTNNNGGFSPAIDGAFGVRIGPGGDLSGSGGLIKNGLNKLTISAPITFTGPIILNSGVIEPDAASVAGRPPLVFNGGTLSGNNVSQIYGSLTLSNNSTINLLSSPPAAGLTFSGGSYGGGTLTISNWSGTAGNSGTDDRIAMAAAPTDTLLDHINFAGFNPGAARMPSGEIVPYPTNSTWSGGSLVDNNWSTSDNWLGGNVPVNFGVARVIFKGLLRPSPVIDVPWDIRSIAFDSLALTSFTLSGSQITVRDGGITNNSGNTQTILNNIVLGAAQSWHAANGDLTFASAINSGGFALTIDCASGRKTLFDTGSGLSGSGSLTKVGVGTLTVKSAMTFTGPLALNNGTVETPTDNVLNGRNVIFGGGTYSLLNRTQSCGSFTLTNSSVINLDSGDGGGRLSFTSSTRSGGTLTINGWTGIAGRSGTNDQIFMTATPGPGVLENINFAGYNPGAARMPSGEIVPFPEPIVWDGNNSSPLNDNWSTDANWVGGLAPVNYGAARVHFNGSAHVNALVDVNWDVQGITFDSLAGQFTNSGSQLKIRVDGIVNNSSLPQTFVNSIVMGSTQTWSGVNGALAFSGPITNGGLTLTLDGSKNISFLAGSGLYGSGGLVKNGSGTNSINVPLSFTGPVVLNAGAMETLVNNALNNRPITFGGGALNAPNITETFGALTLTNDSAIKVDNGTGTLTFTSATRTGGRLTIYGWAGFAGSSAQGDKIFITAKPSDGFLAAVTFDQFAPGAIWLASTHELVPGTTAIWVGLGNNNSWETATNWLGSKVPKQNALGVRYDLVFDGTNRLTPVVPSTPPAWQVLGLTYTNTVDVPPTVVSLTNPLGGYLFYTNIVNFPGGFTNSGAQFTIGTNGIVNNRNSAAAWTVISNDLILDASQTWKAAAGVLGFSGTISNSGGQTLTIDGNSNTVFGISAGPLPATGALTGTGGLVKKGKGTLQVNFPLTFAGSITNSVGVIETLADNVLRGQNITMNGGALSGLSRSNALGQLTLVADSKIILDAPGGVNPGAGTLLFSGGNYVAGLLYISNWTGTAGVSGLDDKIFMTSDPGTNFLAAVRFVGFSAGAIRLGTGELVPSSSFTWNGGGVTNNWSIPQNWVGSVPPPPAGGSATVVFDGFVRLNPVTDASYDIQNIIYSGGAGAFVNSGSPITLESNGVAIVNLSSRLQSISNNLTLGAAQTWLASAGPLAFFGSNTNGGKTLTIDGGANVSFGPGGGLSGLGGLIKNGTGTLTVSAPMTFTGGLTHNSGTIATPVNSVFNNSQTLMLNGGTFSALSTTQAFTGLTFITNSTINLEPGNTNGVLTFGNGSLVGGSLTINGWTGVGGQPGTDDRIIVTADPGAAFLSAVQFTGFKSGAKWLSGTGEIVPPSAPIAPTLSNASRPSATQFQLTITGEAGQSYTIQSSTNFIDWVTLATTNAPSVSFTFIDNNATNAYEFYRVFANP